MKDYPSVFIVSLLTSLMYIVFVVFWAWSFSWTFLIGYAEPLGGGFTSFFLLFFFQEGKKKKKQTNKIEYVWHPSSSSYGVMTFLIFIFFWTSSLFGYIQNYILCEITCFWYFNRYVFFFLLNFFPLGIPSNNSRFKKKKKKKKKKF